MKKSSFHSNSVQKTVLRPKSTRKFKVSSSLKNLVLCGRQGSLDRNRSTIIKDLGTSLVAQWLRICLPMQGTRVRAMVWEDPTCRGATKPASHNY